MQEKAERTDPLAVVGTSAPQTHAVGSETQPERGGPIGSEAAAVALALCVNHFYDRRLAFTDRCSGGTSDSR